MSKIVLHIGTEKTATTSLQSFFSINKSRLSKAGIWYPNSENLDYCQRNAHFPLAASMFTECPDFITPTKYFQPEPLFAKLFKDFESREEHTLLLSAEHFSSRCSRPERISRLGQVLAGRDVEIIVYLRPQHELLLSAYSTFLKSGGKKTLEEVARQQWLRPGTPYFNYLKMVERWWETFGDDSVTVRIFQKEQFNGGSIYTDFMATLGVGESTLFEIPERQNLPITKELADFLYLANQHFPNFNENDRKGWEMGQQFRAEVTHLFPHGRPLKDLLCAELNEETKAFFAEFNAELARRARPDLNGALFIEEESRVSQDSAAIENAFGDEFISWVIEQWKSGRSLKSRLQNVVGH